MKKIISFIMALGMMFACTSCSTSSESPQNGGPQESQMKAICELAVMKCYYHNVAKYTEEDAEGFFVWKKDKKFWIEYSGVVTLGVDVSQVSIEIEDNEVTITLPEAKVFGCEVDSDSLTEDSFIVAKGSASIDAADEVEALKIAQTRLAEMAANDRTLLANARQQVQNLLEDYISNIGNAVGKEYSIKWIDVNKTPISTSIPEPEATPEMKE